LLVIFEPLRVPSKSDTLLGIAIKSLKRSSLVQDFWRGHSFCGNILWDYNSDNLLFPVIFPLYRLSEANVFVFMGLMTAVRILVFLAFEKFTVERLGEGNQMGSQLDLLFHVVFAKELGDR